RYRVERELGAGGMATVYLARDLKHGREVAMKVLKPELAAAVGAERFLSEIEVTAGLSHPHIVPLFDSGEADGLLYYVMPLVEGESLRDRLSRGGPLPIEQALSIAKDVAAALTYAHGRGVIHRDIKPANVLMEDGEALVADFGIAVAVSLADRAQLTATGLSVGTPGYMSPEQIGGEAELDGRSDVYALGCLLYEMLVGEPPFTGSTMQAVVAKALTEPPPSARDRRSDVPEAVGDAITRALAKRPGDRFDTARELHDACAAAPTRQARRAFSGTVVAISVLVAVVVGLGAWRTLQVSNARSLLPEIARLAEEGRYVEAYDLAVQAERWIEGDPTLSDHMSVVSDSLTVVSEPEGAEVFLRRFGEDSEGAVEGQLVGVTPLEGYRVPRADHRVVVAMEGFVPLERIASSGLARELVGRGGPLVEARHLSMALPLRSVDALPLDMVEVPGGPYEMVSPDMPNGLSVSLSEFLIDRHEVSNERFRAFVANGGYAADEHWLATPDVVRSELVDRTGLPGPRDWVRQDFSEGEDLLPVTGVSWYEASAYCSWDGKRLPTLYEWEKTARDGGIARRGVLMPWGLTTTSEVNAGRANLNSSGPVLVDAYPFGVSPYGAYGMAGNVREWTANEFGDGRAMMGGAWDGPSYLFSNIASSAPDFASTALGFRCAHSDGAGDQGSGRIDVDTRTPVYTAVDETTYRSLLAHYR
ncbi:MAG: SUMF1/EgtB/PvdO family nonheme iron enzyme, partial [Gemmatimonadetes bacterium]|nr:SUMF1/EgtB/PvdO family nonheme iron enzyme [Gemmatimonadota bacterium]